MSIIKVFTDCHLFGPHEINVDWEDTAFGEDCYDLGDNIDIRGCKPKDLNYAKKVHNIIIDTFWMRKVWGNHELDFCPDYARVVNYLKINKNTLLTHGDFLFWGHEKASKYRQLKPASGSFLKRAWVWLVFKQLAKIFDVGVSKQFRDNCIYTAMLFNVEHIICSHIHPRKRIDLQFGRLRVTILPRGKSEVEIND